MLVALSLGASAVFAEPAPTPALKAAKCFGIVKAGKNDGQTAASSCAGTCAKIACGANQPVKG